MLLQGLHLLLTYRCTFECDHCFVFSGPHSDAVMPLAMAKDAIDQAAALGTVTDIYVEGGEPFLYYPILLEIIRHTAARGLQSGIVTNGYFAATIADAEIWLRPLRDAGLSSLSVSDDSFHSDQAAESTPAARAAAAARRLGISTGTICIEPPRGIPDDKAKGAPILGGDVRFRGRAADKLLTDDLPRRPWDSSTECPDEDFVSIGRLHLDPYGFLYPCQGVVVGDLTRRPLAEIVRTYDPHSHPVIRHLLSGGPAALIKAYDLPLSGEYVDACHLCFLARRMLCSRFPAHLGPPQVYGGGQQSQ